MSNEIEIIIDAEKEYTYRKIPKGPNLFSVGLDRYAYQPWDRNKNVSQWFNYGLGPESWKIYATNQLRINASHVSQGRPELDHSGKKVFVSGPQ